MKHMFNVKKIFKFIPYVAGVVMVTALSFVASAGGGQKNLLGDKELRMENPFATPVAHADIPVGLPPGDSGGDGSAGADSGSSSGDCDSGCGCGDTGGGGGGDSGDGE